MTLSYVQIDVFCFVYVLFLILFVFVYEQHLEFVIWYS